MKDREYRLAPLSDCLARAMHNACLAPSPPPAFPQPSDAIVDSLLFEVVYLTNEIVRSSVSCVYCEERESRCPDTAASLPPASLFSEEGSYERMRPGGEYSCPTFGSQRAR